MEDQKKEMTPEEVQEMKENMLKFYKEQIPFLETQSTYEKHLADIAENRARRVMMDIKLSQLLSPPQDKEVKKEERKLKTD